MSKINRVYVRFVCFRLVEGQRQRLGLFQALGEARDCDFAPDWALRQIGEVDEWFKDNLAVPNQFEQSWGGTGGAACLGSNLQLPMTLARCIN